MKHRTRVCRILVMLGGVAAAAGLDAQEFSVPWFTIDGGGGTSAGGDYALSGTVGQPDAAVMTGGEFSLQGGFWPGVIPTSVGEPPALQIAPAGIGLVTISWAPVDSAFVLQVSETLLPGSWINAPSGATNPITLPSTLSGCFYRVRKP